MEYNTSIVTYLDKIPQNLNVTKGDMDRQRSRVYEAENMGKPTGQYENGRGKALL